MLSKPSVGIVLLLLLSPAQVGAQITPADETSDEVIIVDPRGGADYESIQAAVDAANSGDVIRVRGGTYRESVVADINVTITAPRGATLNGSNLGADAVGFSIRDNATVRIRGFTITDYQVGVQADSMNSANWVIQDTIIQNMSAMAIGAVYTTGDWEVKNVTIENSWTAISATYSSGDWLVKDSSIRGVTEGHGIKAAPSSGDWTLENVTIANVDFIGVSASYSRGDWRILNTTVRRTLVGIGALETSGDWAIAGSTIVNTTVSDRYDIWQPPLKEGVGLHAEDTNGSWRVHASRFTDNSGGAIVATGASPAGDATQNWWGDAAGPATDDCVGNVNCSAPLSRWPPASIKRTLTPTSTERHTISSTEPDPDTPPYETTAPSSGAAEGSDSPPQSGSSPSLPVGELIVSVGAFGLVAGILLVGHRREWF